MRNAIRLTIAAFLAAPISPAFAQIAYQAPSPELVKVLEAPSPPVARVSPNRRWLLVTSSDPRTITIRDMAEPAYYLAGSKIRATPDAKIESIGIVSASVSSVDGKTTRVLPVPAGGRIGSVEWSRDGDKLAFTTNDRGVMGLHILDAPSGRISHLDRIPTGGRIRDLSWSGDNKHVAFTVTTPAGVSLWVADVGGSARRLTPPTVTFVSTGGGRVPAPACSWINVRPELLCKLFPADRGAPPKISDIPTGPVVQESYGRSAPARTYEYLLSSPGDEKLFDYYFTDQLAIVGLNGGITRIGSRGIHTTVAQSPDGSYLLVRTVQRPYSYQVPLQAFPYRTEVWNVRGAIVRSVAGSEVAQDAPGGRDAVVSGIRNVTWRGDAPATLLLVEALDSGNPRARVPKHDRISLLPAPFSGTPAPFFDTEYRYGGITWVSPSVALITERLERGARTRTWLIDPSVGGGSPRLIWDRSSEDRYSNPGTFLTQRNPANNREIPLRSADGRSLYLADTGATDEGARPFLDRFDITTGKTERLWRASGAYYETVEDVVDPAASRIITRRESPTEPPNYFVRDIAAGTATQITNLRDPSPFFSGVKSELITYSRPDGVKLSATMYLPPGYDKSHGRLPFLFWAYPREFQSDSAASQIAGSPYEFKRPTRANYLLMLLHGYGVLDNPTMPIVGRNGKEPNDTYVEQLVADAQAAADKIVAMGVADRDRLAIGGHSYGAFMTVNLLAHSDIFRTGIAESGAYNRTLTPFGFQSEPRNYWEAPEIYNAMSPFNYADKINEPVLLIHGQRDDNSGTFPINSERLFAAIKGLGGSVRYVQLPLEPHGYTAVETTRHLLWEYVTWLDRYVKNAGPRTRATE